MGFWNKLGKIALSVAPYVAAPFTGGASLLAAPLANKAVSAWSAHDAANNAAQGLAPSSFDKYLGIVDNAASIAGGLGAMGGMGNSFSGSNFTGAGGSPSNFQKILGGVTAGIGTVNTIKSMTGQGGESVPSATSSIQQGGHTNPGIGPTSTAIPRTNSPFSQPNQNNPNLADSLSAGRQAAYNGIFGNQRKRLWTPMTDQAVPQNGY